ncbi:MAG: hypothetical protein JWQ90_839 [Hydrocarboniphaga sp.]|uniref:TonB-dependent receptor n=1 Tax=Hydrocarboniphaga sp. TaxID=2033016 RepID=UPI002610325C|nr:TonB-dependent receptor [Hydrocarboniphaga sp.]MDB5968389.1 hypothetical protein [Hydrocarboniphaga sp.]
MQVRTGAIAAGFLAFGMGAAQAQSAAGTEEKAGTGTADAGAPESVAASAEGELPTVPVQVAADEAAEPAEARPSNRLIEEVVVTAQKREENLQDVPISVQAFSAGQLDAKGIEEPKALALSTPGMQYNIIANYTLIYIRGVGTDVFIPSADASIATYIDGVYFPFGHGLASSLGSVERIEILKGPQGTLFGRNSTGGAINIITKQPGDTFEGNVLLTHENFDKTNLRAFTNIPVTDEIAVSLSGLRYTEDSYYKQAVKDEPRQDGLPKEISQGYSIKVGIRPFDDLKAVFGRTYLNTKGSQAEVFPTRDVKPLGVALGVTEEPDYVSGSNIPLYGDNTTKVWTADIKYNLPWLDMRFIGGDQNIKSPALIDFDGSSAPLVSFEAVGQFAKVKTAELQFISNDFTYDWLKWIGGLYYIKSSAGFDPLNLYVAQNVLNFLKTPTGPLEAALGNVVNPLIGALEGLPILGGTLDGVNAGVTIGARGIIDTKSTAGFAQATADITDWAALTLGARYQVETRSLVKSTSGVQLNPGTADESSELPLTDFAPESSHTTNLSPKAVIDFKINDKQHTYFSFSKGFKSGTYNIINIYERSQYIKPEEVTTLEAGYKAEMLDGAMRLNGAIFQNKIDNLQSQSVSLLSGGATRFETAGGARIRGADFDLTWQALPETLPGLVVTGGGAYLKGVYTDYQNGSGYDDVTGLFFGGTGLVVGGGILPGRDFTGNTLVRTPKFSGNAGLSYAFNAGHGSAEIAGDYYYNTGFYFSAQNVDRAKQDPFGILNLRASYLYDPWSTRITVFGKNLTDTKYYYGMQEFDFDVAKILAPPATYGVRVEWNF